MPMKLRQTLMKTIEKETRRSNQKPHNHHNFLYRTYYISWKFFQYKKGWGAGAGCFWLLGAGAGWVKNQEPEPEPLQKKQEPEPHKIYRLLEDKKHKEIVHLYSSLGKIVSFYG